MTEHDKKAPFDLIASQSSTLLDDILKRPELGPLDSAKRTGIVDSFNLALQRSNLNAQIPMKIFEKLEGQYKSAFWAVLSKPCWKRELRTTMLAVQEIGTKRQGDFTLAWSDLIDWLSGQGPFRNRFLDGMKEKNAFVFENHDYAAISKDYEEILSAMSTLMKHEWNSERAKILRLKENLKGYPEKKLYKNLENGDQPHQIALDYAIHKYDLRLGREAVRKHLREAKDTLSLIQRIEALASGPSITSAAP
jgi:hypothetical protein